MYHKVVLSEHIVADICKPFLMLSKNKTKIFINEIF